ncbi:MAG: DUF3999 family protein [Bryobacteraceae bacterium]
MVRAAPNLLAFAAVASAAFTPSAWQFRRPLPVGVAPAVSALRLDAGIYRGARTDLADLRIVHDGREVPYVLERLSTRIEDREVPADVLDKSISGGALHLTLATHNGVRHNRVRISTPRTNFRQRVTVETSDDNRRWSVVRDDAEVFDFTEKDRTISVLSVDYPESTRPYVRLTIRGWSDPDFVSGAWIRFHREAPAVRVTLASLSPQRVEDAAMRSTLLTLDFGAALPCNRLEFDSATPRFSRAAEVEFSAGEKQWTFAARGVLARREPADKVALDLAELHSRYLRVHVFNRDDRPLDFERVRVEADERRVTFESAGGGAWWLYYGNPEAKAPEYDLAAVLPHDKTISAILLNAGDAQTNPDYRPPAPLERPWTERHPALLYATLALAIVLLGAATIRFLRGVSSQPPTG